MKALLLAAGLGTRLKPLTNDRPKALVEVGGITLLERNIRYLHSQGIDEIIVNVHHFGEQIIQFVQSHDFGITIRISDERAELLDTGGAIKHAAPILQNEADFLVYNVDVICDMDLMCMYKFHIQNKALVTMATRHRNTQRYLLFDSENQLKGRYSDTSNLNKNDVIPEKKYHKTTLTHFPSPSMQKLAFSGIHWISCKIFNYMPSDIAFPILPLYLELAPKHRIQCFLHDDSFWMDMGKPESIRSYYESINNR